MTRTRRRAHPPSPTHEDELAGGGGAVLHLSDRDTWVKTGEAEQITGLSRKTLQMMARAGTLRAHRLGPGARLWAFNLADLKAYLRGEEARTPGNAEGGVAAGATPPPRDGIGAATVCLSAAVVYPLCASALFYLAVGQGDGRRVQEVRAALAEAASALGHPDLAEIGAYLAAAWQVEPRPTGPADAAAPAAP